MWNYLASYSVVHSIICGHSTAESSLAWKNHMLLHDRIESCATVHKMLQVRYFICQVLQYGPKTVSWAHFIWLDELYETVVYSHTISRVILLILICQMFVKCLNSVDPCSSVHRNKILILWRPPFIDQNQTIQPALNFMWHVQTHDPLILIVTAHWWPMSKCVLECQVNHSLYVGFL